MQRKISVKVIPRASRNMIEEIGVDQYVVRITTVPEQGKANDAVVKILAKHLGMAPSLFDLVSGGKGRMKVFVIK